MCVARFRGAVSSALSRGPVSYTHLFRGPATLPGFFDAPEANATAFTSDGFYRSGDMMTARVVDGQTCYTFEGRLRDNINRGGEKIGCEEVEAQVGAHPAVAEALSLIHI